MVFMQPQRLIVPLFQRPYVWNQENQWDPLWNDVVRVADRLLRRPNDKYYPHFPGAVEAHDVLLLNRELLKKAGAAWTDETIRSRTDEMAKTIVGIWPVPEGHRSGFSHEQAGPRHKVDLSDLINAGLLQPGMSLFPGTPEVCQSSSDTSPGRTDRRRRHGFLDAFSRSGIDHR